MHVDVLANVCDMTKHSDDHINGVQGDATCAGANDEECDAVHIGVNGDTCKQESNILLQTNSINIVADGSKLGTNDTETGDLNGIFYGSDMHTPIDAESVLTVYMSNSMDTFRNKFFR